MAGGEETREQPVRIAAGLVPLTGYLAVPAGARGSVLLVRGSGSSQLRRSRCAVARAVRAAGFATLRIDLLSREEAAVDARTGHLRFDTGLLAERLVAVTDWLVQQPTTRGLQVGYFSVSTSGAAALAAAAARPAAVGSLVAYNGRPDLAGPVLPLVRIPTLFIVAGADLSAVSLHRRALRELGAVQKQLVTLAEAVALWEEEAGIFAAVARLAADWFRRHLSRVGAVHTV